MSNLLDRILAGFPCSPRLAILMSGEGSNAKAILEKRGAYPDLNFRAIITDRKGSKAQALAELYGLDFAYIPGSIRTPEAREEVFARMASYLREQEVDFLIYAGFMKISTPAFCQEFPGINTHPADLTLKGDDGKPRYTGMPVIEDAIKAGETYLASTVHVVDAEVDCGAPIAVSNHLPLADLDPCNIRRVHQSLKTQCEHHSYPKTLELLAAGTLSREQLPLKLEGFFHDKDQ